MEHAPATDHELLCRYREMGDSEAFSQLCERHRLLAYRVALGVLRSPQDAEDAAQDAFLSLMRYAPRVRTEGPLRGLVARMALRSAQHLAESAGRRRARETVCAVPEAALAPDPAEDLAAREERRTVRGAVDALHDRYRVPVELYYYQGLTTREVADALGLSQTAVTTRLSRAVARLRDHLRRSGVALAVLVVLGRERAEAEPLPAGPTSALSEASMTGGLAAGAPAPWWRRLVPRLSVPVAVALVLLGGIGILRRLPPPPGAGAAVRPAPPVGPIRAPAALAPARQAMHHPPLRAAPAEPAPRHAPPAPERRSRAGIPAARTSVPAHRAHQAAAGRPQPAQAPEGGHSAGAGFRSAVGGPKAATKETPAMKETAPSTRQWPTAMSLPLPDMAEFQRARAPEDMPLAGVLGAAMDLLGDDLGLQWDRPEDVGTTTPAPAIWVQGGAYIDRPHAFFMGVAGEAFTACWFAREGQQPTLDATLYWPDPGAPYRRALAAAGYTCEVLVRPGLTTGQRGEVDEAALKARVLECLVDRHLPVIAVGVPERNDFLLVTGYDDDGETLTGWVSRGGGADIRFEAAKRVRARDWPAAVDLVVLLTGRQQRPAEHEAIRDALEQAERIMRARELGPFHAGPATFEVWAEAALSDRRPAVDPKQAPSSVSGRSGWLIVPATWDLSERASYAVMFLRRAATLLPGADAELKAAMEAMGAVDVGMQQAMGLTGGNPMNLLSEAERDAKLADPVIRRQVADVFLRCKDKWLEAADHLAKALPLMK